MDKDDTGGIGMKRSEINKIMRDALGFIDSMNWRLPPFATFSPEDWKNRWAEYAEVRDNMLGWDITDFGSGHYEQIGLFMFTIRNGNLHNPLYKKTYCEKLLIAGVGQVTPYHYHMHKMEDIINRGGGVLAVKVYGSTPEGSLSARDVTVSCDGRSLTVRAGTVVRLHPGESITLPAYQYHSFWGEGGIVLIGEVSKVNDDNTDNHFLGPVGRFPAITEDEPPLYLLYGDYAKFST